VGLAEGKQVQLVYARAGVCGLLMYLVKDGG